MSKLELAEKFLDEKFAAAGKSTEHSKEILRIIRDQFNVADEDLLTAALLHDVWEDTDTTWQELEQSFGPRVTTLIKEVSHPKKPTKDDYKTYHKKLLTVSDDSKRIKIADQLEKLDWVEKMLERSQKMANYHLDLTKELSQGWTDLKELNLVDKKLRKLHSKYGDFLES